MFVTIVTLVVRIVVLAAIWKHYGWWASLIFLALLMFIQAKKLRTFDRVTPLHWIRVIYELVLLVFGVVSVNAIWGVGWAVAIVVIYFGGMIISLIFLKEKT